MAEHNTFGNLAEEMAVRYLLDKGYTVHAKNYRYQRSEIDIIAEFQNTIVIVEVKARGTDIFAAPEEAVTKKKIRRIVECADHYLQVHGLETEARFDIISVLPDADGTLQISHLEDAFQSFDAN